MVAKSSEDGEEACTCVKVERPRPSGNSKKCSTKASTSKDGGDIQCCLQCPEQRWSDLHLGRQVEWMACKDAMRYWMYRDDCGYGLNSRCDGDTRQLQLAADCRSHSD